jgi:hypothetical protein
MHGRPKERFGEDEVGGYRITEGGRSFGRIQKHSDIVGPIVEADGCIVGEVLQRGYQRSLGR